MLSIGQLVLAGTVRDCMATDFYGNTNIQFSVQTFCDFVQSNATNFDGFLPDGAISTSGNQIIFAAGSHGGLIDPTVMGIGTPLRVLRVLLSLAGQSAWSINLIDGPDTIVLASGSTETSYSAEKLGYITQGQQLQITSTGAGSVMATVTLASPNFYIGGV